MNGVFFRGSISFFLAAIKFINLIQPQDSNRWVGAVRDSPKPPPERVTLTLDILNRARCCLFVLGGSGKQQAVDVGLLANYYCLLVKNEKH